MSDLGRGNPQPVGFVSIFRRIGIASLVVGLILLAAFSIRLDLAGVAIRHLLSGVGLTSATLRVEEADLGRLVLSEVGVGKGQAVTIRRLSLAFTPSALLKRRIDRLDVQGMVLAVHAGAEGLSVAGLDVIPADRRDGGGDNWAIAQVGLTDVDLAVKGPVRARLRVAGNLAASGEDRYRGDLRFQGSAGISDAQPANLEGTFTFTASATSVAAASLALTMRELSLPGFGKTDVDATLALQNGELHVTGRARARRDHIAFDMTGTLPPSGGRDALHAAGTLGFDLAEASSAATGVKLSAVGRVAAEIDGGSLTLIALDPIEVSTLPPDGPWAVRIEPADAPVLTAELGRGDIHSARVHLGEASITALDRSFRVTRGDAILMPNPVPKLELLSLRLTETGRSPRVPPLSLAGQATLEKMLVPFTAAITARDGKARADMAGTWDLDAGKGDATIELRPLRFVSGKLQPRDLAPALALPVTDVSGDLSIRGSLGWRDGGLHPSLRVRVKDLSFTAIGTRVRGVAGTIHLTGLRPPQTPPGQVITIDHIDAGVPLAGAEMHFQLDRRRRLGIERASIQLLGGRFGQTKAVLDMATQSYRGTLEVEGISLQSLLDLAALDGATATGRVSGRLPILYEKGAFTVAEGRLTTEAPGILRYTPTDGPAIPGRKGEGIGLALQALENFHYDSLSLDINGGPREGWTSRVRLSGKNPDFMDGHPFAFNIDLSGDLDRVVMSGLLGVTMAERIQDSLKRQ